MHVLLGLHTLHAIFHDTSSTAISPLHFKLVANKYVISHDYLIQLFYSSHIVRGCRSSVEEHKVCKKKVDGKSL